MISYPSLLCSLLLANAAMADLTIEPVPADAPQGFNQVFTKHVDVLGLHVYASSSTANNKVLHAARTLAQWIDNDEDGIVDEPNVHATMVSLHASMIMWQTENEFEQSGAEDIIPESVFESTVLQLLFGDETRPGYPENQNFDASLEECLHLVTFGGYARTYPGVFGEFPGTQVADAMDANIAGGWFHYDDWTCEYDCLVTEYTYWALTSMLGAQNYSWRIPEITQEWRPTIRQCGTSSLTRNGNSPPCCPMTTTPQPHPAPVMSIPTRASASTTCWPSSATGARQAMARTSTTMEQWVSMTCSW